MHWKFFSPSLGSTNADGARFTRLRRLIVALGTLAIAAFAASSAFDAWRSHQDAIVDTDRELGNLAKALAEEGARSLQTIDVLLRDTAQWYEKTGATLPPARVAATLNDSMSGLRQVRALTIADAHGVQRHRAPGIERDHAIDVSDRSYFIAQRDRTASGLFVSEPIVTRSEQTRTIILSRRLQDERGRFAGIVTALVDLQDVRDFYQAIKLGRGSSIDLLRDDGTLILREPDVGPVTGYQFPELMLRSEPGRVWVSRIDGRPRYVATAHLTGLPLVVAVTREKAVALDAWRDMAVHVAVRTLLVALLALLTIAALLHQLRTIEAGERALRVSEERYALAMDAANEGHWDWDIAGDRLFLSRKMWTLHGCADANSIITRAQWMKQIEVHLDDAPRLEAAVQDHLQGRTAQYECEYRVRHPDGTWHWLLSHGRCVCDATGKPYRFVGSAMDVTVRNQAQAEKENLEAQLQQSQKMEAVGTLAGGIAHDFNNILGAIMGYAELALKHGADTTLRRYLDNVMQAAARAKALVERILAFSRSGLAERTLVNVQSVVEEALELLAASLPPNTRLEQKPETGAAAVSCEPTQLHQVVMNLCTNGIQAMPHGGILSVTLARSELSETRQLSRGTLPPGRYVKLAVTDTGTGIPPDTLPRIFDPFFTTKGVGEGTGLGLSLVHGSVADLGGAIDISTKVGSGSTFEIWLPVAGETTHAPRDSRDELPRGNGETVMVLDDEPLLVTVAEEMLAELGYEPVGFHSSRAALEEFHADPERFDAILADETMPELLGTQLVFEIRRLRSDIPVVLMTGRADAELMKRATTAGIHEVLRKPLVSRDIAYALARVLRQTEAMPRGMPADASLAGHSTQTE